LGSWWRIGWGSIRLEGEDLGLEGEAEELGVGLDIQVLDEGDEGGSSGGGPKKGKPMDISIQPMSTGEDNAGTKSSEGQEKHANALLTLALLHILHATTTAHLSRLAELLPPLEEGPQTIQLTAKDVASFSLGPWSAGDAKYLEWLADKWGGGRRVVVRRTWRDLTWVLFGYG